MPVHTSKKKTGRKARPARTARKTTPLPDIVEQLQKWKACDGEGNAMPWVRALKPRPSWKLAWTTCPNVDWMRLLVERLGLPAPRANTPANLRREVPYAKIAHALLHNLQATASGYRGQATASGYLGQATASGDFGQATASGDFGQATASGYRGQATASGYRGQATASGDRGQATASGYLGQATASGYLGQATASGDRGQAQAELAAAGANGLLLLRWWDNAANRPRVTVAYVGESGIEPNVYYRASEKGVERVGPVEEVDKANKRRRCPKCGVREDVAESDGHYVGGEPCTGSFTP